MIAETTTHAHATGVPSPIAQLNDVFRRHGGAGRLAVTAGVLALGNGALPAILVMVRAFYAFTPDNDPYGEHDFGSLEWGGTKVFWKIDCYDRDMVLGSPDPADPAVTTRVLTIMTAAEY